MTGVSDDWRRGRIPALDGLRAVAFFLVFLSHLDPPALEGGGVGVLIFFVLSGYLITTLLLREVDSTGRVALGRFYIRRAARLMPAVVLVAVATLVLVSVLPSSTVVREGTVNGAAPALLYFSNWVWFFEGFGYEQLGLFGHFWSLSVEEQFYLAWPLMVLFAATRSRPTRALGVASLVTIVGSLIVRVVTIDSPQTTHLFFGTHAVADQLAWGALLALTVRTWPDRVAWGTRRFATVAAMAIAALVLTGTGATAFGATGIAASSALIIGFLVTNDGRGARWLAWGPLSYLGRISYGLYLWHILAGWVAVMTVGPGVMGWVLAALLTVGVSALSWRWVEQPVSRTAARAGSRRGGSGFPPAASARHPSSEMP